MVTLAFSIVAVLSLAMYVSIDTFLYKTSWFASLKAILDLSIGAGRWILVAQLAAAFAICVFNDYRLHKEKKQQQQSEGEAGSG